MSAVLHPRPIDAISARPEGRRADATAGLPVDILGIAHRRWPAMLAIAIALPVLAVAAALVFPRYDDATARVLYNTTPAEEAIEDRAISAGFLDRSIENAIEVASGDAVREVTATSLGLPLDELPGVDVSTEPGTDVVVFTVAGTGTEADAELANAWAASFLTVSRSESLDQIELAVSGLEERRAAAATEGRTARITALETMIVELETEGQLIDSGSDRIVSLAETSTSSSAPISRNLVFATAAGLFLAAGAGLALDARDRTVRSAADLAGLGVPVLGTIRHLDDLDPTQIATATLTAPGSVLSDDHHRLRSALATVGGPASLIAVVSHTRGEGRTSVATNLAAAFAEAGERTVLVDTDFRAPGLKRLLRLGDRPGLVEWVNGRVDSGDVAHRVKRAGFELAVVPTGQSKVNGPALIGSQKFGTIVAELRADADRTVFDTSALASAANATALCAHVDAVIMVARVGVTTTDQFAADVDEIERAGGTIAGVALIDARVPRRSH